VPMATISDLLQTGRVAERDCSRSAPSERHVQVSLHAAQASQRPCDRPVSSHRTCWLHDTTQQSMPLRGREHQCNTATVICNTFYTDSSLILVPRHRREVCSLARRVMLPRWGATRIHPMTERPSLFPTPLPALPLVGLTAFLPHMEEQYGLTTFHKVDTHG